MMSSRSSTRTELVFEAGHHQMQLNVWYARGCKTRPTTEARATTAIARGDRGTYWENEFHSIATDEPELLAYHRSEAGHLRRRDPAVARAGESALATGPCCKRQ